MTEPLPGLDALHGFRAPPPPGSLAAYAVMIAAGILVAVIAMGLVRARMTRRRTLRTLALAELAQARDLPPPARLAAQAALLRKLAIASGGPADGWRQGEEWLLTLDRLFSTTFFSQGAGRVFGRALYEAREVPGIVEIDRALARLVRHFNRGGR